MIHKRLCDQERIFSTIQPEILDMLHELKRKHIQTGLITNCYLEERDCFEASALAPLFDVKLFSCEQGICKPQPDIFLRCCQLLGVAPDEIMYVGDGGSNELQQAVACGMQAVQACWFLRDDEPDQPCGILEGFRHVMSPHEIVAAF